MHNATENCPFPEIVGKPLKLELKFTFLLELAFELNVLGKRKSSVEVDTFSFVGENILNR